MWKLMITMLPAVTAVDCTAKLVKTMSGPSSTCEGYSTSEYGHFWPINLPSTSCHGWQSTANGEVHDNSANNIQCASDGNSITYDQYAGNLDCSGTAVSKSFVLNECHQGRPPTLYDMAIDLACCSDPDGAACTTGVPSATSAATTDETVYLGGELCDAASNAPLLPPSSEAPSSPEAPPNPCFPDSAMVTMADGMRARIGALRTGDVVIAATAEGALRTDTVHMFSIAEPGVTATFLTLTTHAKRNLTLTPEHHVPIGRTCCKSLKQAKDLVVGDILWVLTSSKDGKVAEQQAIAKVTRVDGAGLHSPVLTNGGFPIVDDFITSFDSFSKVTLATYGLPYLTTACEAIGACELLRRTIM
mmetsp:Transcript_37774/g.75633  ORF Transcript_37774/g.75633 Transcript_37774/m.75633 type:complete len:360 (-) Transcript_37774:352-1431(-)